jgi:hypothetical protein
MGYRKQGIEKTERRKRCQKIQDLEIVLP